MSAQTKSRTTWAIALDGQDARYPGFEIYGAAIRAAFAHALLGYTATVLRVEGPDNDLVFTPLAIVAPPAAPKEDSDGQH